MSVRGAFGTVWWFIGYAWRPPGPSLLRSRVFLLVLLLKLTAGTLFGSHYPRDLFVPFVGYYAETGQSPWRHFAGRQPDSFPYPPVMLYALTPGAWAVSVLGGGGGGVTVWHFLALRLPLLASDVAVALVLAAWFPHRTRRVLYAYWCSPLTFYVLYWHGQLDIIPTALFLFSLLFLRRGEVYGFAAVFGTAVACKAHLLLIVPVLAMYLVRQFGWRRAAAAGLVGAGMAAGWVLPYAPDPAFREMVFGTPEARRLVAFQLDLGGGSTLLVAPAALLLLAFRFSAYPKYNWDLLMLFSGISFCALVTLAPPRPAYVLWSLPLVVYFVCRMTAVWVLPLAVYTAAYFVYFGFGPESDVFDAGRVAFPGLADLPAPGAWLADRVGPAAQADVVNLAFTAMVSAMAGMVLVMYRYGVRSNAVYRLRTRPAMVGLAGDSGAGKDHCCDLLAAALGADRTLAICGDDYHRWPRGHELYRRYTHLDVRANDLRTQADHVVRLSEGQGVEKGTYDHATGRFTPAGWVDPRECVIFSGLHTLANEAQRGRFDLTVFLDPDEQLRENWKVARDARDRGYTPDQVREKLRERAADREKFILPQRGLAEVVARFRGAADLSTTPCGLEVTARTSFSLVPAVEQLQRIDTLRVAFDPLADARHQTLVVEGTVTGEQLAAAAGECVPNLEEVSPQPDFAAGLDGVLQLVLLACLSDKLRFGSPPPQPT